MVVICLQEVVLLGVVINQLLRMVEGMPSHVQGCLKGRQGTAKMIKLVGAQLLWGEALNFNQLFVHVVFQIEVLVE